LFHDLLDYYHPLWLKNKKGKETRLHKHLVGRYLTEITHKAKLKVFLNHDVLDINDIEEHVKVTYLKNGQQFSKTYSKVFKPLNFSIPKKYPKSDQNNIISKHLYELNIQYLKSIPKNKKIIIVGGGKGAIDLLENLYNLNLYNNVHIIIRTPRIFRLNEFDKKFEKDTIKYKTQVKFKDRIFITHTIHKLFYEKNTTFYTFPYYKKNLSIKNNYLALISKRQLDILENLSENMISYGNIQQILYNKLLINNRYIDCDYLFYATGSDINIKSSKNVSYILGTIEQQLLNLLYGIYDNYPINIVYSNQHPLVPPVLSKNNLIWVKNNIKLKKKKI
jgi:hypothetical protein